MTDETETLAPPAPSPPTAKLLPVRSATDRYLAGVAGGLGERIGIDSTIVRAIFVGGTIALASTDAPLVPLFYLVAWLLMPTVSGRPLLASIFTRSGAQEIAAAVLLVVLVIGVLSGDDTWLTIFLVIAGLLLADVLLSKSSPAATSVAADLSTNPTERESIAARWGRSFRSTRTESGQAVVGPDSANPESAAEPAQLSPLLRRYLDPESPGILTQRAAASHREPALWPLTLAALVIWVVGAISVDQLVDPGIAPGVIVNGAVLIIGAIIALSAWRGRAGLLTWLLLAPLGFCWLIFSVDDVHRYRVDGQQRHVVASATPGETLTFAGGYGEIDIDLRALDLPPRSEITVKVRQTSGDIDIIYPDDVAIAGTAKVRMGSVHSPWTWNDGLHVHSRLRAGAGPECYAWRDGGPICDPDAPTILFDIDTGVGSVDIWHPHEGDRN